MPILPPPLGLKMKQSPFSPVKISNLDLWLDASDGNTLYDATSGGSLVTTDGATVKRWEDKSGNSNHATEGTNAPALETAEKNGLNAISFASSKYLTCSFTQKTITAQTTFAVIKYSNLSSSFGRAFTQSNTSNNDYSISGHYIQILRNSTANALASYAGSSSRSAITTSLNAWYIARAKHSGASLSLKLNTTLGADYSHTLNNDISIYRIGAAYIFGGGAEAYWNSLISEIIVYAKNLTESESDSVTNYLNNKWAVY